MSQAEFEEITVEANRCWEPANIHWTFTRHTKDGVTSRCSFDLRMRGAAGLYSGNGRVQVDPTIKRARDKGRVLGHEVGHYLALENVGNTSRLLGPMLGDEKPGTELTKEEIATARSAAAKLTRGN
jgi:hypothetical protein